MIRHTVVFTLVHPHDSEGEAEFLSTAQRTLTGIEGVNRFEISRQVSPKSDFRFQFSMEFDDLAAYQAYDQHPDHVGFVASRWVPEVSSFQELDFEPLD